MNQIGLTCCNKYIPRQNGRLLKSLKEFIRIIWIGRILFSLYFIVNIIINII